MKVVLNNGQYKITIPKELAEEKGWGPGTKIRFVEDLDGNIILKVIEQKSPQKTPQKNPISKSHKKK
jgi:AbrB family looped-hinge helix DNA binding protein